jgi:NAD(P)-dependent dehydrogenase (short-subunit alcohol dehydrogenase family)
VSEAPESRNPFRLDGRVALVTGAGSADGIGQAIARIYAAAGAAVALADQDGGGAHANARGIGERALGLHLDVTQPESVAAGVAQVELALGPIDILVNNAGITRSTMLWETSLDEHDQVMAINLRGGFICAQAVLKGMMARRWGRLIWMSSIAGKQGGGVFGTASYAASKAGVIGLCQAAARQLGPYGITSNAIAPGLVLTSLRRRGAQRPPAPRRHPPGHRQRRPVPGLRRGQLHHRRNRRRQRRSIFRLIQVIQVGGVPKWARLMARW